MNAHSLKHRLLFAALATLASSTTFALLVIAPAVGGALA